MRIGTLFIRRVHKWIGLVIGLQLVLWTLSGLAMALLDMKAVAGGERAEAPAPSPLPPPGSWPVVRSALGNAPVTALSVRPLLDRQVIEAATPADTRLFDAGTGAPLAVDEALATRIAAAAHPGAAPVKRVSRLDEVTLAVRKHALPIWRIDFADAENSSYYVSGESGKLLERRNDSWRWWDFFWMLHNMDYRERTSFNHPLIIVAGFGALWLALTGFLLLFRTAWRPDLRAFRALFGRRS